MRGKIYFVILVASVLVLTVGLVVHAYPQRPVTLVCPYGVGGGTDIIARVLARHMEKSLGVPVIVENKTGAGGAIGFSYAAQAKPDGYNIVLVALPIVTLPVFENVKVTHNDLRPIGLVNGDPGAVIVRADSSWRTLDALVKTGRSRRLRIGTTSPGAAWWIGAQVLKQQTGIQGVDIPYAAGAGPMLTALAGGEIEVATCSAAEALSMLESGEVRILAVMSEERLPFFPDIPTCKEEGYDVTFSTWRGIMAPKNTPDNIAAVLEKVVREAAHAEAFEQFLLKNKYGCSYLNPKDFKDFMDAQFATFTKLKGDL